MPKKSKTPTKSPLDILRKQTAYGSARTCLSLPFIIAGTIYMAAVCYCLLSAYRGSEFDWSYMLPLGLCLLASLTCWGIVALAGALFDMADCAVKSETRARLRDAKDAQQAIHANRMEL